MKTIKQIANEMGVSKTAVRKKIENLSLQSSLRKNGNQFAIDEVQERLIKSAFLQNETQTKITNKVCEKTETDFHLLSDLVSTYKQQLEVLNNELDIKNKQIEELNKRLAESQSLLVNQQSLNLIAEKRYESISTNVKNVDTAKSVNWFNFWKK